MAVQLKEITIAHSPDSDDAFMFYGLAAQKLNTLGLKINQVLKDIQTLNLEAIEGKYEVSAISFASYPLVAKRYALMPCGSSMGFKYGPILVSTKPLTADELSQATIAIPGKLTTAYLTLQLFQPGLNVIEMPFNNIAQAVKAGQADAGLIIHEGQLTYNQMGLVKVLDLGEWWFDQTGLPLPLGGNVIRKDLGKDLMQKVIKLVQGSIAYSLSHRQEALAYAMKFARDMNQDLADKFVSMYVNDFTLDYGHTGRQALVKLFQMSYERSIVKEPVEVEFVHFS